MSKKDDQKNVNEVEGKYFGFTLDQWLKLLSGLIATATVLAWTAGEAYEEGFWHEIGRSAPPSDLSIQRTMLYGLVNVPENWFVLAIIMGILGVLLFLTSIERRHPKVAGIKKSNRVWQWLKSCFQWLSPCFRWLAPRCQWLTPCLQWPQRYLPTFLSMPQYISSKVEWLRLTYRVNETRAAFAALFIAGFFHTPFLALFGIGTWLGNAEETGKKQMDAIVCEARGKKVFPTKIYISEKGSEGASIEGMSIDESEKMNVFIDDKAIYEIAIGEKPKIIRQTSTKNIFCKKPG